MAVQDIIRSYLLSLGYNVDTTTFNKFQKSIEQADKLVKDKNASMAKSYEVAGASIVATLGTVILSTAKLIDTVAQLDLGYQKFALRMYMSRDAARQFKIVTDAMGESLENIAWLPELNTRYKDFMERAAKLEEQVPADFEQTMRLVRDVRGEFTMLKAESIYVLQSIGYFLVKNLLGPITKIKEGMGNFNTWVEKNLPDMSKKIANWLGIFIRIGETFWDLAKKVYEGWDKIFGSMPGWEKKLVAFGAAATALFVSGPWGKALLVISAISFAIDDLWAHIQGRPNVGNDVWNWFLMPLDTAIRGLIVLMTLWDRFKHNFVHAFSDQAIMGFLGWGPRISKGAMGPSQGQARGLSVAEEVKEAFKTAPGIFGPNGFMEQEREKYKEQKDTDRALRGLSRIGKQESDNRYNVAGQNIPGKGSAFGKYQIMPENWARWSKEFGLGPNAQMTPENQELVAQKKWLQYYKKYGSNQLAAAAWYGGEGIADRLKRGDTTALNVRPREGIHGPTVGEYIAQTQGAYNTGMKQENNIEVNIYGTTEDQAKQVEDVLKKYTGKRSLMINRFPAVSGVTP